MPQSATEAASTATELWEAWDRACRVRDSAAAQLAYDVTFRAEDPYAGQHDRPSATLTAKLKANYRAAYAAADTAYDAWYTRNDVRA